MQHSPHGGPRLGRPWCHRLVSPVQEIFKLAAKAALRTLAPFSRSRDLQNIVKGGFAPASGGFALDKILQISMSDPMAFRPFSMWSTSNMSKSERMTAAAGQYWLVLTKNTGANGWVILGGYRDVGLAYRRMRTVSAVIWDADYKVVEARELDWSELI